MRGPEIGPRPQRASFFDRVEQYGLVSDHVAFLTTDPDHIAVFSVLGLGGSGKSRFLAEVHSRLTATADAPTVVAVSLESEASTSAAAPLLAVRDQLAIDCFLFDAALVTYWTVTDQLSQHIGVRLGGTTVPAPAAGEPEAVSSGHVLTFAARVFASIPPDARMRLDYRPEDFAGIDQLGVDPGALLAGLPEYLAADVRRHLDNPQRGRLVVLYDDYDKQSHKTLADRAPWLQTLLRRLGTGVHVVASREPLGWDSERWGELLHEVRLGPLPEAECRRLARRELGDLDRDVEDALLRCSDRMPFHLHATIAVCRIERPQHGSLRLADVPPSAPAAVERLVGHLAPAERTLALSLAAVQYFDEPLYGHLVHALALIGKMRVVDLWPATTLGLGEFAEWFFVSRLDGGLYCIHRLLSDAVRRSPSFEQARRDALSRSTAHVAMRALESPSPATTSLPQLFRALVEGWTSVTPMASADVELLVDIGYALHDAGYWRGLTDLAALVATSAVGSGPPHPARVVARYFAALALRRTESPAAALAALAELPYQDLVGRHATSFDLEVAYLKEIDGDYRYARGRLRELHGALHPYDPTRRDHVRARLYHADLLTMDGDLAGASRVLVEAYDVDGIERSLKAELIRHRGHAYRFSCLFDDAKRLYLEALEEVRDTPSMVAKLRTNLAETRCWYDARRSLQDAELAIELNTALGSRIEVTKALSARAVAAARLGLLDVAGEACAAALQVATGAGYPAGTAFALQARVVTEALAGDRQSADAAYGELVQTVRRLDTYGHLCVIPAWLRGDDPEFQGRSREVRWATGTDLSGSLRRIAGE